MALAEVSVVDSTIQVTVTGSVLLTPLVTAATAAQVAAEAAADSAAASASDAAASAGSSVLGIATADCSGSAGTGSFTAHGRNAYTRVETGGGSVNNTWSVPDRTDAQPLMISYRVIVNSGATPQVRLQYTDGSFSTLQSLTADGRSHFLLLTHDAGKTANGVQFRTVANTNHTASCIIEDGATAEAIGDRLSGVAGQVWRNGIDIEALRTSVSGYSATAAEVVAGRGAYANLDARFDANEANISANTISLGIATANPTGSAGWDTFTALSRNSAYYLETATATNYVAWTIPSHAAGSTITVLYKIADPTGETPFIRLLHSDASQGTLVNLVADGEWHSVTLTVATGKTATSVRIGTNAASSGYVTALIFTGSDLESIARGQAPVPSAIMALLDAVTNLEADTIGAKPGLATADPTGSGTWDSFTANNRNSYTGVETGGASNNAAWAIPNRGDTEPLIIAYQVDVVSGETPYLRLAYSDATFSGLTTLIGDGKLRVATITPDSGKTATAVHFRTVGNSSHTAWCYIADGSSRPDALKSLPGVGGLAWAGAARRGRFSGKTVVIIGDSQVENGDYPERLAEEEGCTVIRGGFGGCCLSTHNTGSASSAYYDLMSMAAITGYIAAGDFTDLIDAADDLFALNGDDNRTQAAALAAVDWDADNLILLVDAGTNDYGIATPTPLGSDSDTARTTIKGGINKIIADINGAKPNIQLGFVTPIYRDRIVEGDGLDSDNNTNSIGVALIEIVDAIKNLAGGGADGTGPKIPVRDLYRDSGVNGDTQSYWLADGLHWATGHGWAKKASLVSGFLHSNF